MKTFPAILLCFAGLIARAQTNQADTLAIEPFNPQWLTPAVETNKHRSAYYLAAQAAGTLPAPMTNALVMGWVIQANSNGLVDSNCSSYAVLWTTTNLNALDPLQSQWVCRGFYRMDGHCYTNWDAAPCVAEYAMLNPQPFALWPGMSLSIVAKPFNPPGK